MIPPLVRLPRRVLDRGWLDELAGLVASVAGTLGTVLVGPSATRRATRSTRS